MKIDLDELIDAFDYVRVLGTGGTNHMGLELTVKCKQDLPLPDDNPSRESIKRFLLQALDVAKASKSQEPEHVPLCYKCSEKMVQPDLLDKRCHAVVGCKSLTKQQWEKGQKISPKGISYQSNCPIYKK